jgi:hypothetical protein
VESGGPHVYVWRAKVVRVGRLAWLTGAGGLQEYLNLNQAIGFVQALGIWIGMGDEDGTRASLR